MEITAINQTAAYFGPATELAAKTLPSLPQQKVQHQPEQDTNVKKAIDELEQVSLAFNRRLQFSFNSEIDQVVVKVIDKDTDKVIKEIPPKELQVVYERIREAVGVLFDERI